MGVGVDGIGVGEVVATSFVEGEVERLPTRKKVPMPKSKMPIPTATRMSVLFGAFGKVSCFTGAVSCCTGGAVSCCGAGATGWSILLLCMQNVRFVK